MLAQLPPGAPQHSHFRHLAQAAQEEEVVHRTALAVYGVQGSLLVSTATPALVKQPAVGARQPPPGLELWRVFHLPGGVL